MSEMSAQLSVDAGEARGQGGGRDHGEWRGSNFEWRGLRRSRRRSRSRSRSRRGGEGRGRGGDLGEVGLGEAIGLAPVADGGAEPVGGEMEFALEFGHFFAGGLELTVEGLGILGFDFFPVGEGVVELLLSGLEPGTEGFRGGERASFEFFGEAPLLFGDFGEENAFGGDASQVFNKAGFVKEPDAPFGGIELPWFGAVPVIVLEGVMKVVITLAEGEQGHDGAVAGGAASGVRLAPDGVTEGIDEEGHLLDEDDSGNAGKEKGAKRGRPSAPEETDGGGEREAGEERDEDVMAVLPADEWIAL
jgi:hypothetical protein